VIRHVRKRMWLEAGLAIAGILATVATLISREWIEIVFRVDPDGGTGSLEWGIVALTATLTILFSLLARHEWRRTALATA
jgi:hypothetical protein